MSNQSPIEWTDATWNPVRGCVKVSPGCAHCYAETFAERFRGVKDHPYEQGFDLRLVPEKLAEPLTWQKPRRVFVNSMSDLFQDGVPDAYIDQVFAVMALATQHTFQVLTKRPERMRKYFTAPDEDFGDRNGRAWWGAGHAIEDADKWIDGVRWTDHQRNCIEENPLPAVWPLPNVWLGVSVENQHCADARIPLLLQTPAAVRFISAEPLLSDICIRPYLPSEGYNTIPGLDWVIVGGESGHNARPFDVAWARSIVAQCHAAGVAVFYKQGGRSHRCDHDSKGGCFECMPPDLQIREFPNATRP